MTNMQEVVFKVPIDVNLRRLKNLRRESEFSQREIGEYLGLSKVSYCKREKGVTPFSLAEAKMISDLFGLPVEKIFFEN